MEDAKLSGTLDESIARRVAFLTDYQDAAYATKYKGLVDKVRAAEQAKVAGSAALSEAVARYAFKSWSRTSTAPRAPVHEPGEFEKQIKETARR